MIRVSQLSSPVGPIVVAESQAGLCALAYRDYWVGVQMLLDRRFPKTQWTQTISQATKTSLSRYFSGDLDALRGLKLDVEGSAFAIRIWTALLAVPAGTTTTYGELADTVGQPGAVREAGQAVMSNPLAIVIPCHRALASNGVVGSYAGGMSIKRWLLVHEGVRSVDRVLSQPAAIGRIPLRAHRG